MYLYNPDDEDQLNRLLGQQVGGAAPDSAAASVPQPAPTPQPTASQPTQQDSLMQSLLAAQAAKQDPQLEQMWSDREKQALQASATPQYGGAELARDVIGPGAALIVDLVANHGRGATGILATGAQAAQQNRAADVARAQKEAELAIKMHGSEGKQTDPLAQALAVGRLGVAQQNAGTNAQRQGTVDKRLAMQSDINSPLWQARIAGAGQTAGAGTTGRLNAAHELNDQTAQDAANIRSAQTAAQIETTLANAPATAAAAANQAAGVETAKVGAERAAQAANRPAPEGRVVTNQLAYDNVWQDPGTRAKFLSDEMSAKTLESAMNRIVDLRKQNGPQWLPSPESGEYKLLQSAVIGSANRTIMDAGTLNAGERQFMENLIPGITPNWKDFVGWLSDKNTNLNAQQLEGIAKGLQDVIDARMSVYGVGRRGSAQPAPAPGLAAPAPAGGDVLPVTGGRVPKVNQVIGAPPPSQYAPNGLVTIRYKGETRQVPAELAQQLKAADNSVEVLQ